MFELTLPIPKNEADQFTNVPAQTMAEIRSSGYYQGVKISNIYDLETDPKPHQTEVRSILMVQIMLDIQDEHEDKIIANKNHE